MSSQWTSKYAIMRDLSLAQGRDVPAHLEDAVGVDEKPPAPNITEETEEEYYGHWIGDGDTSAAPDLTLIQQMLEMVRGTDISSDCENEPDKVLEITKACIQSTNERNNNTDPKIRNKNNTQIKPPGKPKKKRVNVAVNSILEAMAGDKPLLNMEKPVSEPLKLLKPIDFMTTDKEIVDSVEKVNGWLNSQHQELSHRDPSSTKPTNRLLNWEPSAMFKRKGSTARSNESDSVKSSPPQQAPTATASYRPSALADEYYQKYVERSKMKPLVNEDVWTKAERIMKEMDMKKKAEADVIAETEVNEVLMISKSPSASSEDMDVAKSPDEIQLPQHRHGLTGPCVVCDVVKAHGVDVDTFST